MFISSAYAQQQTELHTETGVADDGHHEGTFPPFDSTHFASQIVWLAITFGLFYIFLSRVIVPRIGGVIETRRDRIASDLDQAARMKQESDAAIAAYEQELAQARQRANVIAQKASDEAKNKSEDERRSIEEKLDVRLKEAEKRIGTIRDKAMQDVGTIAEETAGEIVTQLIGADVDSATIRKAVKAVGN